MIDKQDTLISLECLLDTTVGLLFHNFHSKFGSADLTKYAERLHNKCWDIFEVDENEWKAAWAKRDMEVLKSSSATVFCYSLKSIVLPRYFHGAISPTKEKMTIHINTYPFQLTNAERDELKGSISEILSIDIPIVITYIPLKELTPAFIKDTYKALFLPDLVEWLTIHNEELGKVRMPKVIINAPAYFLDVEESIMDSIKEEGTNPLELVTQTLAEFVGIKLLRPLTFSLPTQDPS